MTRPSVLGLLGVLLAACNPTPPAGPPVVSDTDVHHFVAAYANLQPSDATCAPLRAYLDHASPGLHAYISKFDVGLGDLCSAVRRHPMRYDALAGKLGALDSSGTAIQALFAKFSALYPEGRPPDVYFVVGDGISAGSTTRGRHPVILIGMERNGSVDGLVPTIAHEFVHTQQHYPFWGSLTGGPRFLRATVLRQSITEGSADFIAELVTGHHHTYPYGEAHEAALWAQFQRDMHSKDFSRWLYNGRDSTARAGAPPDLGYFMGYRITQAYFRKTADTAKAIHRILHIRDFDKFLAESGYHGPTAGDTHR